MRHLRDLVLSSLALLALAAPGLAQQQIETKVPIAFNRFYTFEESLDLCRRLCEAYPELLSMEEIGRSVQDRPIVALTLNNPKTGPHSSKPGMYVDANIHGNEIQVTEAVLYAMWYLVSAHGQVPAITELVDRVSFYFLPVVNPDGRVFWFEEPNTSSTSRGGQKPVDNDRDGEFDEDGPDDLDGDGSITMMWRPDPNGTHRRSELDPNRMEPVTPEVRTDGTIRRGTHSMAGMEGIDNDGDGQINEDGPGGYDPNRNWPADWHPEHVQSGAGDYPLSLPESRCVAEFILERPNIAGGLAYHNTGAMILRGPGAQDRESIYAGRDRATYDAIARAGEEMLPFYRYLVTWSDLYPVRGGFKNWLSESLGIVGYTMEMWTDKRILQNNENPNAEQMQRYRSRVLFGQTFTPLTEYEHPSLGPILIGGPTKWSSRIPPPFMAEEEYHRNLAFIAFHAGEMPAVRFGAIESKDLGGGLWQVDVELVNDRLTPTRTERAASRGVGQPDRLTLEGATVLSSGIKQNRFDRGMSEQRFRPATVEIEEGVPGRGSRFVRFLVTGTRDDPVTLRYSAEKASELESAHRLGATAQP